MIVAPGSGSDVSLAAFDVSGVVVIAPLFAGCAGIIVAGAGHMLLFMLAAGIIARVICATLRTLPVPDGCRYGHIAWIRPWVGEMSLRKRDSVADRA